MNVPSWWMLYTGRPTPMIVLGISFFWGSCSLCHIWHSNAMPVWKNVILTVLGETNSNGIRYPYGPMVSLVTATVDGRSPALIYIGLSHYLQGRIDLRWWRISSINSTTYYWCFFWPKQQPPCPQDSKLYIYPSQQRPGVLFSYTPSQYRFGWAQ